VLRLRARRARREARRRHAQRDQEARPAAERGEALSSVLVTGAAGFIGSHVVERLVARGWSVTGLDNLDPYYAPAIKRRTLADLSRNPGFRFVEGDVRDEALVARLVAESGVDGVVHLAAKAGVRPSIQAPQEYASVNVVGTTTLLEAARRARTRAFVLASSSSVYGARRDAPFRETDAPAVAMSPYAATKQACEAMGRTYHALHGLDVTALRFFTAYGPRQRPDLAVHKFSNLLLAGDEIPFYGDGSTRRDYTYVEDIAEGVVRALESCPGTGYRVFNLGHSATVSLAELVASLEALWGRTARLARLPEQPGDVPLTCADLTIVRRDLGFAPSTSFGEGLAKFAAWRRALDDGPGA
jgi:UDP-glucuronate 4-epimerase